jgi:hypothetical protein
MAKPDLTHDCQRCDALCCVTYAFDASPDFAHAKPAHTACRFLTHRACSIHAALRARGYAGCASYTCFGAGQRATRAFPPGRERTEAFLALRALHEQRALLELAVQLCPRDQPALWHDVQALSAALDALPATVSDAALPSVERAVEPLLARLREVLTARGAKLSGAP